MESHVTATEPSANGADAMQALEKLEGRIQGAIRRLHAVQEQRAVAEQEATRLKAVVAEKSQENERLRGEVEELRSERDEVRARIEALLQRIEGLDE